MTGETTLPHAQETADRSETLTVFLSRVALALGAASYGIARLDPATGTNIAIAAAAFILLDIMRYVWLTRAPNSTAAEALVIVLQVAAIASVVFVPRPLGIGSPVTARIALDTPLIVLLMCYLASNAVAARPALLWVSGGAIIGAWVAIWLFIMSDPRILTHNTIHIAQYKSVIALLRATNGPFYFSFSLWWKGGLVSGALITCALGLSLYRTRRLARASAKQEVRRRALAAYFSPQLVEIILRARDQGYAPKERRIAVLDCDLVGFTRLAETATPEDVAAVLRLYRSVLEDAMFERDGAILSHVGDGAVALFGLSGDDTDAAVRAVSCALAVIDRWPSTASAHFGPDVPLLAIGIDIGATLVGLVGDDRSLSLLATGSTIDQASLLQQATREMRTQILISDDVKVSLGDMRTDSILEQCSVGDMVAWRLSPEHPPA